MTKTHSALIFIEDGSFTYDNRIKRIAHALVHAGWNITVISPKYADDRYYTKFSDSLRAYHYPKPHARSATGHLFEHAISLAFGFILTTWVRVRHGFRIFHACNPMDILWLVALPHKVFGARIVFDQHDLCPELYESRDDATAGDRFHRALMWLERQSFQFADVVISTNESYKAIAVGRGGKEPKDVFVVRNGPELQKFPQPQFGIPQAAGSITVGYLGNMNPQDGVELLIEAANVVVYQLRRRDLRFVLVGGGSSQPAIASLVDKLELQEYVRLTGRVPDGEMLAELASCDICVQPDPRNPLNDVSTMNKVMEYMALGKPVVAFDLAETRVSCGEAALYAQPNEVKDLAAKIVQLADQPELRLTLAKSGRARVEQMLAWNYSVPSLLAAYHQAAASTSGSRLG